MGYVRDEKTGKFTWVEGDVSEDAPRREVQAAVAAGRSVATARQASSSFNVGQAGVAVFVLCSVAFAGWRAMNVRHEPLIDLRRIHAKPAEFEGKVVRVRGSIGQVFPMGDSYAYYLLQGADTIVVYTHGARPQPTDNAEVCGSITVGYLDGSLRPALFQRQ